MCIDQTKPQKKKTEQIPYQNHKFKIHIEIDDFGDKNGENTKF